MDVYIHQAALWCEDCANTLSYDDDSGGSPEGPFPDGGGEADCPQHCAGCGVFLENPLTGDGVEYVRGAIQDWQELSQGNSGVISTWQRFYTDVLRENSE